MHKPPNHPALSPYLLVENAQTTLDFIQAVLGCEPSVVHRAPDGQLSHIEVPLEDSLLMIGHAPGGATPCHIHLYVPDVDAVFAKALSAGGKVVREPSRQGDNDRRGGITDPSGTTWWFSTFQGN